MSSRLISKDQLKIRKGYKVLDIGGGDFPHPKANVVVDKYVGDNTHRGTDAKFYSGQQFIQADAENLPFKDNEFDYVVCTHVLEHASNPGQFVKEMCRVGKRGYLETPSVIGEYLIPKESHQWVLLVIDGKLVMYDKEVIGFKTQYDFGALFLGYFPRQSMGWKIMQRSHFPVVHVRLEWEDSIEVLINPEDEYYKQYFTQTWTPEMVNKIFPKRSFLEEAGMMMKAMTDITMGVVKNRISSRKIAEAEVN